MRHNLLVVVSSSLTVLLVGLLFFVGVPFFDLIELKTYDLRVRSRGHVRPTPAVALAVIDEKSLDAEGRWPWPRSKLATLVDIPIQVDGGVGEENAVRVREAGASLLVAGSAVFADPSPADAYRRIRAAVS